MADWVQKLILGTLISVVGFFLVMTYNRLASIECQISAVQVDIAKMRILTADDVRQICRLEYYKFQKNGNAIN